jgi:tRNA A58 N-methylase Trm61
MGSNGYLYNIGWINSFNHQMPIDKEGNPLPWVTYSYINFISDRLNKTMNIFEYGSGNSTLWYANKVNTVTSLEHDRDWFQKIKSEMPKNVNIHYQQLIYGEHYSKFSNTIGMKFDIVIVDGRDRVNCLKSAIDSLTDEGVIVLDDSERKAYSAGIDNLISQGFKKIDFWGISPGLFYKKNTTVFYKTNNCLGI